MLQSISGSILGLIHTHFPQSGHFISRQHTSGLVLSPSGWHTMPQLPTVFLLKHSVLQLTVLFDPLTYTSEMQTS